MPDAASTRRIFATTLPAFGGSLAAPPDSFARRGKALPRSSMGQSRCAVAAACRPFHVKRLPSVRLRAATPLRGLRQPADRRAPFHVKRCTEPCGGAPRCVGMAAHPAVRRSPIASRSVILGPLRLLPQNCSVDRVAWTAPGPSSQSAPTVSRETVHDDMTINRRPRRGERGPADVRERPYVPCPPLSGHITATVSRETVALRSRAVRGSDAS